VGDHTPGPWGLVEERTEDHDREFYITGPDHGLIAEAYEVADARLIAAAPDLLAAAMRFVAAWDRGLNPGTGELRDAIVKAKGES
jgi:hypothetical protein